VFKQIITPTVLQTTGVTAQLSCPPLAAVGPLPIFTVVLGAVVMDGSWPADAISVDSTMLWLTIERRDEASAESMAVTEAVVTCVELTTDLSITVSRV
jgi:hypothetical protein